MKNLLDRIKGFHQLDGRRRHRGGGGHAPAVHRHARPPRDRAIVHFILGTGHAMTVAVAVVGAITVACLGLVWLLPKSAPADGPGPA